MKIKYLVIGFLVFALASELFLRYYLGFCDAVLIKEDPDYEYIAQPDQNRFRFRNHVIYNSFSMRNGPVDTAAIRILVFGDSVINGGVLTDQDALATELLSKWISDSTGINVQLLNVSAGSWGPDNCFAYLKKHGDFGAKAILLVVSSHDAFDNMNFENIVGKSESYPDYQYRIAWMELIERYLIPNLKQLLKPDNDDPYAGLAINKNAPEFNSGFKGIAEYAEAHSIQLAIFLHAERKETEAGAYDDKGKQIIDFTSERHIMLIPELKNPLSEDDYRDVIHPNEQGQMKIAQTLYPCLLNWLGTLK